MSQLPSVSFGLFNDAIDSRDSTLGIAMDYCLDGWVSIPGRDKIFLYSITSRQVLGPTQPPTELVQGVLPPGRGGV
jgi:hypothetical protein